MTTFVAALLAFGTPFLAWAGASTPPPPVDCRAILAGEAAAVDINFFNHATTPEALSDPVQFDSTLQRILTIPVGETDDEFSDRRDYAGGLARRVLALRPPGVITKAHLIQVLEGAALKYSPDPAHSRLSALGRDMAYFLVLAVSDRDGTAPQWVGEAFGAVLTRTAGRDILEGEELYNSFLDTDTGQALRFTGQRAPQSLVDGFIALMDSHTAARRMGRFRFMLRALDYLRETGALDGAQITRLQESLSRALPVNAALIEEEEQAAGSMLEDPFIARLHAIEESSFQSMVKRLMAKP